MSRGEFGSAARGDGYGSVGSSSSGVAFSSGPGSYRQDDTYMFDKVSTNTQTISSNVSALEKLQKQLGTVSDSEQLRNRIQHVSHNTQVLASETNATLKNLRSATSGSGKSHQRIQLERLRKEFKTALERLQRVQATIQEDLNVKRAPGRSDRNMFGDDDDESAETTLLSADQEDRRREREQAVMQSEQDVVMYEERAAQVQQIERDIVEINEIFRDLGNLVHEQGTLVDNIEEHIETGHRQVEEGNRQLSKAASYQKKARKKMCCIAIILLIGAVAVALIIYFSVKGKK